MVATREQVIAALETVLAVGDAIRELGSVPSGELYGRLMAHNISAESYNNIIDTLRRANAITVSNNLITWVGPTKH